MHHSLTSLLQHHDKFPSNLKQQIVVISIVANKTVVKQMLQGNEVMFDRNLCQLELHIDWEPVGCSPFNMSIPLQEQLPNIIRTPSIFNFKNHTIPMELKASDVGKELKRLAVDAAAAAIEERQCFSDAATGPHPLNAAARFSRQLRTRMNNEQNVNVYIPQHQQILAVGIVFEYASRVSLYNGQQNDTMKTCMLGVSFAGENVTGSFGNHEVGFVGKKSLPPGDTTEIWTEIWLTLLLVTANIAAPRVCECFSGLRLTSTRRMPQGGIPFVGILIFAVLHIIFASNFNPWGDWKPSLQF